jgi:hypothetical protein
MRDKHRSLTHALTNLVIIFGLFSVAMTSRGFV